jgi:hypothetical protein
MLKHGWSIGRIMANIAILAVGMSTLLAVRASQDMQYTSVGVLGMLLALILTAVTDRALFGRRHRAFWVGFTVAGWMSAAMALSYRQEMRSYILKYGPPIVRAREDFVRQHVAIHVAQLQGISLPDPQVSEWYLLGSLLVELSLGLILGGLIASAVGFFLAAVAIRARRASDVVDPSRRAGAVNVDP